MSATIIPFPARPTLSRADRDLIARWRQATSGIAQVYISARRPKDAPDVQDRVLIVEDSHPASGWVVHRPARRWVVRRSVGTDPVGDYGTLAEALDAVQPAPRAGFPSLSTAVQTMPPTE